jgi:hypothetical protein
MRKKEALERVELKLARFRAAGCSLRSQHKGTSPISETTHSAVQ